MKLKQYTLDSDNGFSLLELLVSMAIGVLVVFMGLGTMNSVRHSYRKDVVRTRMNQDLRATTDFVGAAIRQAGEGFTSVFPAIELLDGASGAADQLILRRSAIPEKPSVCANIAAGSPRVSIAITNSTPTSGCAYGSNASNYNAWRAHRLAQDGQEVRAYIYNYANRVGEFFTYVNEVNMAGSYSITADGGLWAHDYPMGTSQIYILEEWTYQLNDDELELVENSLTATPWAVAFALSDFQVRIQLSDGTVKTSFARTDDWTNVDFVELTLASQQTFRAETMTSTLTSRFFPRNVLSN